MFKLGKFWELVTLVTVEARKCEEIKSSSCLIVMTFLAADYVLSCFYTMLQTGCGPEVSKTVIFVQCDCLYSILYL